MTRRIMLIVAYDGTNYSGWQYQPDKATIEGVLNRELSGLLKEDIKVIGASRTDAGVHAEGAVAVFDTASNIPADRFSYALNTSLPEDIVIRDSREVAGDFHPRKTSCRKTYRYGIWNDRFDMPVGGRYRWWVYKELDIAQVERAAEYFTGEHDFAAFCSAGCTAVTTVRRIYDIELQYAHDMPANVPASGDGSLRQGAEKRTAYYGNVDIYVTGNGFLYNMVRIIAGTLIDVGLGRIPADDIPDILASADRQRAGKTAPAKGLTLVGYEFMQ